MVSVLIADNQTLTREGLVNILAATKDIRIVGQATTLAGLTRMVTALKPDVILVDTHYDDQFTIESLKITQEESALNKILALSNKHSRHELLKDINHGIRNHLSKECSPEEVISAVYATAKGEKFLCTKTLELLLDNQLPFDQTNETPSLSVRETEIINLVAEGKTNKEIAEKLFLSIHTIRTHRKNIIKKMGFTFKNASDLVLMLGSLNDILI